jgi:hypothetical protein
MEQEQKNTLQELEDAGSNLPEVLQRNTMRVPDGYFDTLEESIMAATIATKAPEVQKGRSLRIWPMLAAASVIVVVGAIIWQRNNAMVSPEMQFAQMSDAELDTYIDEQIASLSSDEIYNYLSEEIHAIEASDILNSDLMDATDAAAHFQESMHEQVYPINEGGQTEPTLLDEELWKDVDDALLQEYLNNAAIFDDMAL